MISEADVIRAISDKHSLDLFKMVAAQRDCDTEVFRSKVKLSRKQYYFRMSRMTKVGIISRRARKYSLTSLGKILYESERMIEGALKDFWKLKAIDSLDSSIKVGALPPEERNKILDALIDNRQTKEIIIQAIRR
jgi:predicted transcriptional regulator